jgi:hypothetical protein
MNIICKIFGHKWKYLPLDKRECKRCKTLEKRILFTPRFPVAQEKWVDLKNKNLCTK